MIASSRTKGETVTLESEEAGEVAGETAEAIGGAEKVGKAGAEVGGKRKVKIESGIDSKLLDELITMLEEMQNIFDSLYLNNDDEFKYIGFVSEEDKKSFEEKANQVYNKLCNLLSGKYIINNMINIHDM